MSSRRRSPEPRKDSRSSAAGKLRMDTKPQQARITDPSLPAGRRREIDNVMKKARDSRSSPQSHGYWDKKLLEIEAKDPNRWRHSGYKELYIGGSKSPSSPARRNRRSRTRSRSHGRRSPPSPRPRPRRSSSPRARRSLSPRARRSPSPRARRSPSPRPRAGRARSPPYRPLTRRSPSASSVSSCSDDSCSVCSPKNKARNRRIRTRSRSFSVPRSRANLTHSKPIPPPSPPPRVRPRPPASPPSPAPPLPSTSRRTLKIKGTGTDPRRPPQTPPRPRGRQGEVIELPTPPMARVAPAAVAATPLRVREKLVRKPKEAKKQEKVVLARVKSENKKSKRRSPAPADSSGSEDSSSSSTSAVVQATKLTLSERFGKMAQWSVDRRDMENMRITKNSSGGDLKVMINEDERLYSSPPPRYSYSPAPAGHYPEELLLTGPSGLAAWDDVRVRYQYYKDLGYLRDLTLDDYIKWEEWWYKYQEWLKTERYYERWVNNQSSSSSSSRRRRKRLPASQRLN